MKIAKALSLLLPLLAGLAVPRQAAAQTHLDNPFAGSRMYVNPAYTANANAEAAAQSGTLAANMRTVGQQPTAVWFDSIAAVASFSTHLDQALAQGATAALFVVYDLPGRDCAALASNGELPLTAAGLATYKTQYIDAIAAVARNTKYSGIRIVMVVEPDSLPNLVTNLSTAACATANSTGIYVQGVQYAVNTLHAIPNVYLYIDMAHSGWLGWSNNSSGFVSLMNTLSSGFTAGKSAIDGFVDNTANTLPLKEPYMTGSTTVNGQQVSNATFYQSNPDIDETAFLADMYSRFTGAGWPSSIGVLMDTSRNGWGGSARPTGPSTSTDLNTFVNATKIDRRAHRGLWCNPVGAGIGERPAAAPGLAHVDAYVWVKPPGESDGASSDIPNTEGKKFDRMCDPTYQTSYGVLTGAMPNSPLAGHWFSAQFIALVQNAYPPLSGGGGTCSTAPAAPGSVTASATSSSQINLSWGAVTPPSGCSVTYTVHRSTTSNFTPSTTTQVATGLTTTSFSSTSLTASTTYYFRVQAVDAAGSATSAQAQATTQAGTNFTLTVSKAGTGTGTVTSSTGGINCGSTCSASISSGTAVTLTAAAASGSTFAGWSGACTGTGTCLVTMTAARTVTATFNTGGGTTFALTVTKAGTGSGTVTSNTGGISCGSTCSASYASGTVVTLTAAAASGSTFGGWGGSCSGTATTCAVTMSAARSVTATFTSSGGGTGGCHVTYSVTNSWPGGFQGAFSIQNTSSTAWTSWTLTWTFPGSQQITQLWNGAATQSGAAVTVQSLSYNGSVAASATVSGMGFTANGTAATPSSFAVNGVTCN
jgi:cellulose 1,4-beta-cellobiosidase